MIGKGRKFYCPARNIGERAARNTISFKPVRFEQQNAVNIIHRTSYMTNRFLVALYTVRKPLKRAVPSFCGR